MSFEPGVGWAIIYGSGRLAVFVKKCLRRQGHGTRLANAVLDGYDGPRLSYGKGVAGSPCFFASLSPEKLRKQYEILLGL